MKISVIGTGKLGSCMVAYYASSGNVVNAIDNNEQLIQSFQKGECPIQENGLKELLDKFKLNIRFSTSYEDIKDTDITFIIVPTPTDDSGEFYNGFINEALCKICPILKDKKSYHLIVVTSTVKLGSMRNEFVPLVEKLMGRKINDNYGLIYNPEFIALGSVISDLSNPDAILIGESNEKAGDLLERFYSFTLDKKVPVHRMSWENAEIAKLSLNVFVTTKISLANMFAQVCGKVVGGDVDKVTDFLGNDSRIGRKYLKGGLGWSGACFPRDNRAFYKMGERIGLNCMVQQVNDEFNMSHNLYAIRCAIEGIKGFNVSLLGVTFKSNTPIITESPAIQMTKYLDVLGYNVKAYDPMGKLDGVKMADSIKECLQDSDLAVIVTAWNQFKDLKPVDFKGMRNPNIFDCWRLLDRKLFENSGVKYRALGIGEV